MKKTFKYEKKSHPIGWQNWKARFAHFFCFLEHLQRKAKPRRGILCPQVHAVRAFRFVRIFALCTHCLHNMGQPFFLLKVSTSNIFNTNIIVNFSWKVKQIAKESMRSQWGRVQMSPVGPVPIGIYKNYNWKTIC